MLLDYEDFSDTLLAILIIGLLAVIAIPKMLSTDKHVVRITAQQMTADMRYARSLAITNAKEYIVRFSTDPDGTRYEIFQGDGGGNPVGGAVKSMKIPEQVICTPAEGFDLSFYSLGNASTGGQIISLVSGSHAENISVNSVTGMVY